MRSPIQALPDGERDGTELGGGHPVPVERHGPRRSLPAPASATIAGGGAKRGLHEEQLVLAGRLPHLDRRASVGSIGYFSVGSARVRSRSQPSFSILMCSIAMALPPASRSGSAWNSDTQQRWTS